MLDPEHATPLTDEEREGLKPAHVSTHKELNEWEHTNIEQAEVWAFARKRSDVVTLDFVHELHFKMFDETWTWAGQFRKTDKNLGVPKQQVLIAVRDACDDAVYWIEHQTYGLPEIAARYHHRLVCVHAFPNGNGRHARLSADVLLFNHDLPRLAWGGADLQHAHEARGRYLQALREADRENFVPLLQYLNLIPPP